MTWYKNLKILSKLILGFVIVDVIMFIVGYLGIYNNNYINDEYTSMYDNHGAPLGNIAKASSSFQKIRLNVNAAVLFNENEDLF